MKQIQDSVTKSGPPVCLIGSVSSRQYVSVANLTESIANVSGNQQNIRKRSILDRTSVEHFKMRLFGPKKSACGRILDHRVVEHFKRRVFSETKQNAWGRIIDHVGWLAGSIYPYIQIYILARIHENPKSMG